jgi:predicted permease
LVLTNVILPIFFIVFLGFLLRRFGRVDLKAFSRAQLYVLSPALGFMSLARSEADTGLILRVLFFIVCLEAVLLCVSLGIGLLTKRDRAERQAIALTSVFMNTGFYGIPVCMLAFGEWGLVYATIYMVASSITQSTAGIFLASAGQQSAREAFASIFKVPLIWSIILARLLVYLHALPPAPLMKMVNLLGEAAIPLGLLLLGMQLERIILESAAWRATSAIQELRRDLSGGLTSAAIRLLGGLAVSFGMIQLFHFGANMNQVLIVESSMPTAVNAVVFATEFNCRPRLVAVGILASTLASIATVTLTIHYLGY